MMQIGAFGHGFPFTVFAANGINLRDITLAPSVPCPAVAAFIEPFMDPFAASFLMRLGAGALNGFGAIVLLRESPGAVHAFHYGCELARKGLLPNDAPKLLLSNHLPAIGAPQDRFNDAEMRRIKSALSLADMPPISAGLEPLERLQTAQELGLLSGADAFDLRKALFENPKGFSSGQVEKHLRPAAKIGLRYALLGGPLGNSALHEMIESIGVLALDQQALDQLAAQRDFATNPFAARQGQNSFVEAIKAALIEAQIDRIIWQVEPHDDLWGWLAPDIGKAAKAVHCAVLDFGPIPRWPDARDLAPLKKELAP
ncbi:MAG: hypothetical protein ACRBBK_04155 [Paracoccaceae bacterium]